jgi:hypothetical protein
MIVTVPDWWGEDEKAALTRLVNDETNCGWKLQMWMRGSTDVVDPRVGHCSLADFIPMLKKRASEADRAKIDAFMAQLADFEEPQE